MKMQNMSATWIGILAVAASVWNGCFAADSLEAGFLSPPNSAKPHTWYHMMNGNVTKEGITCDFEALAEAGIGGVQMFDAGCAIPPGPMSFNSPEWFDMFKHAAKEARRLGLEICIPNCSGWSSSGGPWNMPSNGMKFVVYTETSVKGPSKFNAKLPRTEKDNGFYEDIAVLAFPVPKADLVKFDQVKTEIGENQFTLSSATPFKASGVSFRLRYERTWSGNAAVDVEISDDGKTFRPFEKFNVTLATSGSVDYSLRYHAFPSSVNARAIRLNFRPSQTITIAEARPEWKLRISDANAKTFAIRGKVKRMELAASPEQVVAKDAVQDLTSLMKADGSLSWDVPVGDWSIMRIGYICNGRCNHPASDHGRGLEVDKLSASAMDYHFDQYVARICRHLGSLAGDVESGFNNILVDSYEVASQNWTQGFAQTFEKRKGYSLIKWLPVFTGRVVDSVDATERFLEDFRRVVADLFAENYAGRLAQLCHQYGLKLSIEPYGNSPSDNLQYGQDVDIPMGEFWSGAMRGDHIVGTGNSKFASYLAHVWGRRYAATESFTASPDSGGRWLTTPFTIKAQGDRAFTEGINRIIYHRFTHQPWPGNKYVPGMTMGRWGMHLDRTQTWWPLAKDWFKYQTRCQWMLQEGTFVADVLFFCGEQAPNQGGNTDGGGNANEMRLPSGYNWDICATKAVEMLKVKNGKVVVPGGVAYDLLVLPPQETMSEKLLTVISGLLDKGAKVCGLVKPTRSPGLVGYPQADSRVKALGEKVWAKGVFTCPPAEALKKLGVEPDFTSTGKTAATIHRRGNGADWYFVALNNEKTETFEATFRQSGRQPEIWDAVTGSIAPAQQWREENGKTTVTLQFQPSGSAFVVFRKPVAGDHATQVEVNVTRHAEPAVDKEKHSLKIVKGEYGVFAEKTRPGCVNVTSKIVPGKTVQVLNSTFDGDPIYGEVKYLEVTYKQGDATKVARTEEHKSFTLPKDATVISAWYGAVKKDWKPQPDHLVDITKALNAQIRDGEISVVIDNSLAGDPIFKQVKSARITYVLDGVTKTCTVPENHRFTLPNLIPAPELPPDWEWQGEKLVAWQPLTATVKLASGKEKTLRANPSAPVPVAGEWKLSFPEGWDAPASVTFPGLVSWTTRPENGIRYFSGTATYTKRVSFTAPEGVPARRRVALDLGNVKNFAEVSVNGKPVGVLWKPPFRVDITDALKAGANSFDLTVKVTNLWPNRLIGDDFLPEDCKWKGVRRRGVNEIGVEEIPQWVKDGKKSPTGRHTFTTWKHWTKEDELLPSGLLGPVTIRTSEIAQ